MQAASGQWLSDDSRVERPGYCNLHRREVCSRVQSQLAGSDIPTPSARSWWPYCDVPDIIVHVSGKIPDTTDNSHTIDLPCGLFFAAINAEILFMACYGSISSDSAIAPSHTRPVHDLHNRSWCLHAGYFVGFELGALSQVSKERQHQYFLLVFLFSRKKREKERMYVFFS